MPDSHAATPASVLMVQMPFGNLRWPNLGPSLLCAELRRIAIDCRMAYFNFDFAEQIGLDDYNWLADHFGFVLGGERLFARHYFGDALASDDRYWHEILLATDAGLTNEDRQTFASIGAKIAPFLDHCLSAIDWNKIAVVGFATSFQQMMPSLCLARQIRLAHPHVKIVFGGAACEGVMGVELIRQFPLIDYVFLGEADQTFPAVIGQLLAGGAVALPKGVAGRAGELALSAAADTTPDTIADLDTLPYPIFDDYFARLHDSPLCSEIDPLLFFETSRGCWWGQKHHCKFCGLNGTKLHFRSKTPERALEELKWLVDRHGIRRACSSDNILDPHYFKTLLPMLEHSGLGLGFVYEMKTNIRRDQVQSLLRAGLGAAQLGIETFSTPILKLIGKGATACQNLQALKWFSEPGIEVKWNVLYGFPGEDPAEYERLTQMIPAISHLAPPLAVGQVRMDRFAPYFDDPAAYGMLNPRANRAFSFVYPFAQDVLARLAYYFEFDFADGRTPRDYAAPFLKAVEDWQQNRDRYGFRMFDRGDGVLLLTDTRPCAETFQWRLMGPERAVYLLCDTGRTLSEIIAFAANEFPDTDEATLQHMLASWVRSQLMLALDGRYLSLAMRTEE